MTVSGESVVLDVSGGGKGMVWPVYIVQKEIQKEFDLCPYMSCTYLQKASVNLNLLLLSIAIWQIEIKFPSMLFQRVLPLATGYRTFSVIFILDTSLQCCPARTERW